MTDATHDERRRVPRVQRAQLAHLATGTGDGQQELVATGRTVDLSPIGIRVALDHPPPPGTRVELTLQLGERLVDLDGVVIHDEPGTDGLRTVGIEFTDLDAEAGEAIARYLDRPPASEAG